MYSLQSFLLPIHLHVYLSVLTNTLRPGKFESRKFELNFEGFQLKFAEGGAVSAQDSPTTVFRIIGYYNSFYIGFWTI